jgi:hypothetical protein
MVFDPRQAHTFIKIRDAEHIILVLKLFKILCKSFTQTNDVRHHLRIYACTYFTQICMNITLICVNYHSHRFQDFCHCFNTACSLTVADKIIHLYKYCLKFLTNRVCKTSNLCEFYIRSWVIFNKNILIEGFG